MAIPLTAPGRRGACPTLDTPMQTGDGLLARLRIPQGRMTPAQLAAIATLAQTHGNGLLEVTARGNLQVRGLSSGSKAAFAAGIREAADVEAGLVIDTSPIAGEDPDEKADPLPLVHRIREGSASLAHRLGPKVSVVIDGDGQVPLAALKADIRLLATTQSRWLVSLGGAKPQAMDADGAVSATLALLAALAAIGPDARATDLFPATATPPIHPERSGHPLGVRRKRGESLGVVLPFAAITSDAVAQLAKASADAGVTTIRLAPGHGLLLDDAPGSLAVIAGHLGFITDPGDPRLRISACIGSAGCASGHIPARSLAAKMAPLLDEKKYLHVSGCEKGCAHPRGTDLTLVGRAEGIGLVIAGRAGDTPQHILDAAAPVADFARAVLQEHR